MRFLFACLIIGVTACSAEQFAASDAGAEGAATDSAPTDSGTDAPAVPIQIVNQTSTLFATTGDPTSTLTPSPTAGNAVIVAVICFSDVDNCSIPTNGVSDNQGNTYRRIVEGTSIISSGTHGTRGYIFIADSVTAGPGSFTITINPNGAPDANVQVIGWAALEVAGLLTANSNDVVGQTGIVNGGSITVPTTTMVTTSGATTRANELAVALHYMRSQDADVAYSVEAGWSQTHVNANGMQNDPFSLVTKTLTSTGVVTHTWQHDTPSRGGAAIIATFKGRL